MNIEQKEYVVVSQKKGKPYLAKVHSVGEETVEVVPEKGVQHKWRSVTVGHDEVIVNLGKKPYGGNIYGCDTHNLYRKTIDHDFWGAIHFFIKPDETTLKVLKRGLDDAAKIVDRMKLGEFTSLFETEIRAKKGKWAGMYRHSKRGAPHTVWYAPEWAQNSRSTMENVILHEFGHVVRFNGVTDVKLRAKWVAMFQNSIANIRVTEKQLAALLKELRQASPDEFSFQSALKTVQEDMPVRAKKAILEWLRQTHKLQGRDLEVLWRSEHMDKIQEYWPTHIVDTHDLKPIVSEYACVNTEELFAESFAFYAQGNRSAGAQFGSGA
jgi:hypothetical protein